MKISNIEQYSPEMFDYFTNLFTNESDENLVVRVFMSRFDFDEQYEIGIDLLKMLGVDI